MEKYFPHCGKMGPFFPRNGKTFSDFSTQWENFCRFFHTMEKVFGIFPHNGKNVSTLWKTRFLRLFSRVLGCSLGAVERSTRRPLSTVERDRLRDQEKRCPTKSGNALSRSRLGCGVGRGRFSGPEVGAPRALRCEGGVAGGARIYSGGC